MTTPDDTNLDIKRTTPVGVRPSDAVVARFRAWDELAAQRLQRIAPDLESCFARWVMTGDQSFGGFLSAFFQNDLMNAVCRADVVNLARLPELLRWIYSYAPSCSYGSKAQMKDWRARGGLDGRGEESS